LADVLDDQVAHPLQLAGRDGATRLRLVDQRRGLAEVVDELAALERDERALAPLAVPRRRALELAGLHPGLEVEARIVVRLGLGDTRLGCRQRALRGPDGGLLPERERGRLLKVEPERRGRRRRSRRGGRRGR